MMISDRQLLQNLGSVGHAFYGRFHELRDIQRQALLPILSGHNVLVTSATASGKTEAVFAPLIARLSAFRNQIPMRTCILAVAPTRALVNDLYKRLETPLGQLSWTCGRQTSDYSDKYKRPSVLITTPESFDSMLVRGGKWEGGVLTDHILGSVKAVFLDEAHLLDSSPRGDQIVWLLARLRRLLNYALKKSWTPSFEFQVCAASATISHPQEIANNLMGEGSIVVQVAGTRELEIFVNKPGKRWEKIGQFDSIEEAYRHILRIEYSDDLNDLANHLWYAIEKGQEEQCRKILVFVPTRALCDKLSAFLSTKLGKRRIMFISGHHGSLEKIQREHAEQEFARRRDAILVATTTLEVGIDIGDVDMVALVGPSPDSVTFLQRVGRAGRRSDCAKIMAIARNELEARAFSSIIQSACRGELEKLPQSRRWSVFIQQVASFVAQSGKKGRRRSDLLHLAKEVWPEPNGSIATQILEHLLAGELIVDHGGRLFLGELFADQLEEGRGSLHHNFESDASGIPVIDSCTGEIIARVADLPPTGGTVALAGQSWGYTLAAGEIILSSASNKKDATTFRYAARAAPCRRTFAEHVRKGLGLAENETPIISWEGKTLWFHFGGSAYEQALLKLLDNLHHYKELSGIAVVGLPNHSKIEMLVNRPQMIHQQIESLSPRLALELSPGKYHKVLPESIQSLVIVDLFDINYFIQWLSNIKIFKINPYDILYKKMLSILEDL